MHRKQDCFWKRDSRKATLNYAEIVLPFRVSLLLSGILNIYLTDISYRVTTKFNVYYIMQLFNNSVEK